MRILALLALACGPALAEPPSVGPEMAVAANFGQFDQPDLMRDMRALGFDAVRDEIHWARLDAAADPRVAWPEMVAPADVSVILNLGHPNVEGGHLPVTSEGRAAFAGAAAEIVRRFAPDSVEVGNELNSDDFVSGPMEVAELPERARLYTALLAETARAVRDVRPETRVIGGAAHSLPEAWLAPMMEAGAAVHMDALAFHPYGVAPEWMGDQIAEVRRLPGLADMPFEATEYGTTDVDAAPRLLIRAHCTMGLAGVTRFVWYALADRGDGLAPLVADGAPTEAGRAWLLARTLLAGRPLSDVSPDPFTRACLYGGRVLVIWGAERTLEVPAGVTVLDAAGAEAAPPYALSETEPLILVAAPGEAPAIRLAPQRVLADTGLSYAMRGDDAFERFARQGDARIDLPPMPGQGAPGTPWRAYRGTPRDGWVRLDPTWMRPGGTAEAPIEIVHAWRAASDMEVLLEIDMAPDGPAEIAVAAPGLDLREPVAGAWTLSRRIAVTAGDAIEVALGPGADGRGDGTDYRIRVSLP